ncbi:hypothetical protein [Amycolatopsis anabasis]|uniref:hypothetical protein n=1 Tax=Amycolatopsis anabasis TaxID=1840409 RepID=UPI00131BA199|nr:hypothetical protein [Amycolatopsis anabasis]
MSGRELSSLLADLQVDEPDERDLPGGYERPASMAVPGEAEALGRFKPTNKRPWPDTEVRFIHEGVERVGTVLRYEWWWRGYTFPVRFRIPTLRWVETNLVPSEITTVAQPWERTERRAAEAAAKVRALSVSRADVA